MTGSDPTRQSRRQPRLKAAIFDVDGVLLASPHERAWREALVGIADPARFTPELYETQVSGKPRMDGALAALVALGVEEPERQAVPYAERKQARLEELVREGQVSAFSDALRFVQSTAELGIPMAVASSSKNANGMMKAAKLPSGKCLYDMFSVNVCGVDLPEGKPNPAIFLLAAQGLGIEPAACFVAEDAPAGVKAAATGGMAPLGIARNHDESLLQAAGADLVVTSFDEVAIDELAQGRLCRRSS
jgi:beta-phosphoglucomutase-like phosphatase (HAD superfamily)